MKKALYSVETATVMEALTDQRVEDIYIGLLEDMCKDCADTVILHKEGEKFPIKKGIRRGDTISQNFNSLSRIVIKRLDCQKFGI